MLCLPLITVRTEWWWVHRGPLTILSLKQKGKEVVKSEDWWFTFPEEGGGKLRGGTGSWLVCFLTLGVVPQGFATKPPGKHLRSFQHLQVKFCLILFLSSPLGCELHKSRGLCQSCSLSLKQCLVHRRCSLNICWINWITKRAEVGVGIGITKSVFGIINSLLTNGLVAKENLFYLIP